MERGLVGAWAPLDLGVTTWRERGYGYLLPQPQESVVGPSGYNIDLILISGIRDIEALNILMRKKERIMYLSLSSI